MDPSLHPESSPGPVLLTQSLRPATQQEAKQQTSSLQAIPATPRIKSTGTPKPQFFGPSAKQSSPRLHPSLGQHCICS